MSNNIKIILISIISSAVFFSVGFFVLKNINNSYQTAQVGKILVNPINKTPIIPKTTIYFVGDIMLTRGVKNSVEKNFNGDYNRLFENLGELKKADILFANLEGAVSDKGNNVGSKYSFRMDPIILPALKQAGFDIVSFANNHVGDWNISGFSDTLLRLNENSILKTGAGLNKQETIKPTIIERNGIKFGFLGFSDVGPNWLETTNDKPGILLASDPNLSSIIQSAKTQTDILIVSFHFGDEYKLIHNNRQETLAHKAIDSGADLIIGHHPHVIEDTEEYKGKTIVYSLGNFIFDQYFSKDTMKGMLFIATFNGKELEKTEQKVIVLNNQYQPEGIFTQEELREKEEIASGVCPVAQKEYEDMTFLNVGQEIKLFDKTYIPKNLRELNNESSARKGICLIKEARDAFEALSKKAKDDGYLIKASSGFRSYNTQDNLFSNGLKENKNNTIISIAKPGYSEHQLGVAVDLTGSTINYSSTENNFDESPEDGWLKENAHLYGFVLSYPKDKQSITGYKYEPWHYRYMGIEKAKEIKEKGITITEFLN